MEERKGRSALCTQKRDRFEGMQLTDERRVQSEFGSETGQLSVRHRLGDEDHSNGDTSDEIYESKAIREGQRREW
jgi:hypothetical protein